MHFFTFIFSAFLAVFVFPLQAQMLIKRSELIGGPMLVDVPSYRKCEGLKVYEKESRKSSAADRFIARKMKSTLTGEIDKIGNILKDIERVHKRYAKIYTRVKNYQEIEIKNITRKGNRKSILKNIKSIVSLNYESTGELNCVVFDSYESSIHRENLWTRRIVRFRFSNIENVEIITKRYDFNKTSGMNAFSTQAKLSVFRSIFTNLQKTLYKMELILASREYHQDKFNEWLSSF